MVVYIRNLLIVLSSILTGIGLTFIIINLNVLAMGISFFSYLGYIFMKLECNLFFVGILLLVILLKRRKKNAWL